MPLSRSTQVAIVISLFIFANCGFYAVVLQRDYLQTVLNTRPIEAYSTVNRSDIGGPESSSKPRQLKWLGLQEGDQDELMEKAGFCNEHVIKTFSPGEALKVCFDSSVECVTAKASKRMAKCDFTGLAMKPKLMMSALRTDAEINEPLDLGAINLIGANSCKKGGTKAMPASLQKTPAPGKLLKHILAAPRVEVSVCDKWIDEPTLLHVGNAVHIYFKLLDLYNVHKTVFDAGLEENKYAVMRIGNLRNGRLTYLHGDFEERLFPGTLSLVGDLNPNATVCFRQATLVPNAYASVPFMCKMEGTTKKKCIDCAGKKHPAHPFITFRERVLSACDIDPVQPPRSVNATRRITLISRKPYERWQGDQANANFRRVLENENQLVLALNKLNSPKANVTVVHLEQMDICEQVRAASESDVLMGVHGAGLVHLWWLRDDAAIVELEPNNQRSNPSFRTLAALSGRNYVSVDTDKGATKIGKEPVRVNVAKVVKVVGDLLKKH